MSQTADTNDTSLNPSYNDRLVLIGERWAAARRKRDAEVWTDTCAIWWIVLKFPELSLLEKKPINEGNGPEYPAWRETFLWTPSQSIEDHHVMMVTDKGDTAQKPQWLHDKILLQGPT